MAAVWLRMQRQFPSLDTTVPTLTAASLKQRLDDGEQVTILDTRRSADVDQWSITHPNATVVNVPFTAFLDGDAPVESVPEGVPDGPLVTCCAKAISSQFVAEVLADAGYTVEVLDDGMEGWATLYEATVLAESETVSLLQYHRPSSGCLAYLLVAGDEAALFDPLRAFTDRYQEDIGVHNATLRYVVDTHVHADHVSGARALAEETDATLVVPAGAVDRGFDHESYQTVGDGDTLSVGASQITAVHLPGHTSELTGFAIHAVDVLLTADALFVDGVGRPDLERGEAGATAAAETLFETLQKLSDRPAGMTVAPGHVSSDTAAQADGTYATTLGELQNSLDFFALDRDQFVDRVAADLPSRPNNYERIIDVNLGQASVDDDTAFELELGPNNCAAPTT